MLASLRLTVAAILALILGLMLVSGRGWPLAATLTLPALLLWLNLGAALAVFPVFRRSLSLTLFHLALMLMLPLALVAGRFHFAGHFELPEGAAFDPGRLVIDRQGPWYTPGLSALNLTLDSISASYAEGLRPQHIRARVRLNGDGKVIAEGRPLHWQGYRLYVTKNVGFSVNLDYLASNGSRHNLSVNFPWFLGNELAQAQELTLGGDRLWLKLDGLEAVFDDSLAVSPLRLPARPKLVVRRQETRRVLSLGQKAGLGQGTLVFRGVHFWQGFKVQHDPSRHWMLALVLLMLGSLSCFLVRRHVLRR
ncbi:hypothetical protein FCL40_13165 [Ferrimonas sediminicola]|uniref:ResB-like domain-containing protein n=1 Tax=Ferrimonas sediminicola TaxID=2569538 RepID=A0A4U1BBV5_9GAMM|nr:hypothetical protein [Ferrimonas sediminicola]TKB48294.1 hypothetical protein FCL40_13165 [Ferrimonas sediminicola]